MSDVWCQVLWPVVPVVSWVWARISPCFPSCPYVWVLQLLDSWCREVTVKTSSTGSCTFWDTSPHSCQCTGVFQKDWSSSVCGLVVFYLRIGRLLSEDWSSSIWGLVLFSVRNFQKSHSHWSPWGITFHCLTCRASEKANNIRRWSGKAVRAPTVQISIGISASSNDLQQSGSTACVVWLLWGQC